MNPRQKRARKARNQGIFMLVASFCIVVIVAFTIVNMRASVATRHEDDMCRKDGFVSRDTLIIIDATDSISVTQKMMIRKEANRLFSEAAVDERFTLYVIDEQLQTVTSILQVCNPGDGRDKSELTANKRRLKARWQETFFGQLTSSVDILLDRPSANSSPVMEMMKYASIETLYDSPAKAKRMILASDMLQNSQALSQYRNPGDFDSLLKQDEIRTLLPQLQDVDVEVLYLERGGHQGLQGRRHIRFWEQFIQQAGGEISRVKWVN
jgi:hypothetical protein